MMKKIVLALLLGVVVVPAAMANNQFKPAPFDVHRMYFGGGLNYNSYDYKVIKDQSAGFQLMLGYDLGMHVDKLKLLVEVGYLDAGEFEDTYFGAKVKDKIRGPWAAAVVSYPFGRKFEALGRLGYDNGDDDGPLLGVGAGFWPIKNFGIRAEAVRRQHMDSLQINFLYRP